MRKDIANPWVCRLRRRIGRHIRCGRHRDVITPLPRLRIAHIEMLKGEPPLAPRRLDLRYKRPALCPRRKEIPRALGVADRRRETDATRLHTRDT